MAKVIQNDSSYEKEKEIFLRDLTQFHETRGTPCHHSPKIGGKEIDLYRLYSLVTSHGGWVKVNSKNLWRTLLQEFKLPKECVNVSVALKQIYLRYLDKYEKAHFLGETNPHADEEDEKIMYETPSRQKRMSNVRNVQPSVPLTYNHSQHQVTDSIRATSGLSTKLYTSSEYDKLALSLLSPLPNEQDFAINVCTLLSNEFRATQGQPTGIKLCKHPRLLRYLLAHAGVFADETLRIYFSENFKQTRHKSLEIFWDDVIEDRRLLKMMREMIEDECAIDREHIIKLRLQEEKERKLRRSLEDEDCVISDGESDEKKPLKMQIKVRSSDKSLFALGRALGTKEYVGQRVLQVATVLRNFTFNDENNKLLSHDLTFLRFMILCCSSNWNCLRQLGLDMFCNVACELTMDEQLAPVLFEIISQGLDCPDRASILSCIEILNKLGTVERNEDILIRSLQQKVYNQVCTLLTLHDIMLLIQTLECLYSLSSLGEKPCNAIMRVHGAIDILVSLVTVEAQSFGPKACILMRVVETVNPHDTSEDVQESTPPTTSYTTMSTVTPSSSFSDASFVVNSPAFNTPPMSLAPVAVPVPFSIAQSQITPSSMTVSSSPAPSNPQPKPVSTMLAGTPRARQPTPNTPVPPQSPLVRPVRQIINAPVPVSSVPSGVSNVFTTRGLAPQQQTFRVMTPNKLGQNSNAAGNTNTGSPMARGEENGEMFATQWLRSNFEHATLPGRAIEQAELYKQYINAASRAGRKGVIAPLHFPRVVRSVFGAQIGPKQVIPAAPPGSTGPPPVPIHVYEGIQVRGKQPIITQTIAIASTPQMPPADNLRGKAPTPLGQPTVGQAIIMPPGNPPSPILKAQLSAPIKPQVATQSNTGNTNTAHPHLSQALLGQNQTGVQPNNGTISPTSTTPTTSVSATSPAPSNDPSASSSLIKSLLANKVGGPQSAASSTNQQPPPLVVNTAVAAQVTQRQQQQQQQQQLLQQQSSGAMLKDANKAQPSPANQIRLNGVCVNVNMANHVSENSVELTSTETSTTPVTGDITATSIPITQQNHSSEPPPLTLINQSNPNTVPIIKSNNSKVDAECNTTFVLEAGQVPPLDGTSVVVNGGISNSITTPITGDKEYKENLAKQSLMLVDLLEKSISDKDPPTLNGAVRIGEKGLELFTSIDTKSKQQGGVIRRVSSEIDETSTKANGTTIVVTPTTAMTTTLSIKQNGPETIDMNQEKETFVVDGATVEVGVKRTHSNDDENDKPAPKKIHVNGDVQTTPGTMTTTTTTEEDESNVKASSTAANLYAALAADVLEDLEEPVVDAQAANSQQLQQVVATTINSMQGQSPIIVQTGGQQPRQILVTSGGGIPQRVQMMGQQVFLTQQNQLAQGQTQTVLVAQASTQPGVNGQKTIIFLQPQNSANNNPNSCPNPNQKVLVNQTVGVVQRTPSGVLRPGGGQIIQQTNSQTVIKHVQETTRPQQIYQINTQQQQQPLLQQQQAQQQQQQQPQPMSQYLCEWRGCMRSFKSANEVYMHACEFHCPTGPQEVQCLWERCDALRRKRFSHMTHLYDRHCNPEVLKMMAVRRKQLSMSGKTEIPPPAPPAPHPGYAPNAALSAIKKHALEFNTAKELQDDNEGPVTKSIRLTSSLILRNLVIYSATGKRHLVSYEPHLATVALSNVESSKTIAQVLYDMNKQSR